MGKGESSSAKDRRTKILVFKSLKMSSFQRMNTRFYFLSLFHQGDDLFDLSKTEEINVEKSI